MPNHFIKEIVSGGQTGVDRAALDVAIQFNIPHGGWCPYGRKAEDVGGIIPQKYNLKVAPKPTYEESLDPDAIYKKRTELNAVHSDGTLIILSGLPSGGTLYTIEMLQKHGKREHCFIFNLSEHFSIDAVVQWIIKNNIRKLNIAGPRASQEKGIYDSAYAVISQMLSHKLLNQNKDTLTQEKKPRAKL